MPRILVVEDDPAILANTVRVLRLEGFDVMTAVNGLEGWRQVCTGRPDLVLCDIRMPEMNGDELLDRMRADPSTADIPLVFATASAENSGRAERLARGARDYLVKPYDFKVLLTTIRRLLE